MYSHVRARLFLDIHSYIFSIFDFSAFSHTIYYYSIGKLFCIMYHINSSHLLKLILYCLFFNSILRPWFYSKREFIRLTRIHYIFWTIDKKKMWRWNRWDVFSTEKFFRHCSCGNWRCRDAGANFILPFGSWNGEEKKEKKETVENVASFKTTPSFVITVTAVGGL